MINVNVVVGFLWQSFFSSFVIPTNRTANNFTSFFYKILFLNVVIWCKPFWSLRGFLRTPTISQVFFTEIVRKVCFLIVVFWRFFFLPVEHNWFVKFVCHEPFWSLRDVFTFLIICSVLLFVAMFFQPSNGLHVLHTFEGFSKEREKKIVKWLNQELHFVIWRKKKNAVELYLHTIFLIKSHHFCSHFLSAKYCIRLKGFLQGRGEVMYYCEKIVGRSSFCKGSRTRSNS